MENIKFVFFDVGYTLVNVDKIWEQRYRQQAETDEAKALGLTHGKIYDEIVQAAIAYQPQYRTVVKKFNFAYTASYRHAWTIADFF